MADKKKIIFIILISGLLLLEGVFFINQLDGNEERFSNTALVKLIIPINGQSESSIRINNFRDIEESFSIYLNNLKGLANLDEKEFTLKPGESKEIKLYFKDSLNKVDFYAGELVIQSSKSTEKIPIFLGVQEEENKFAIIQERMQRYAEIYPGGKFGAEIKIFDLVNSGIQAINSKYYIKNSLDEILWSDQGELIVGGSKAKVVDIPKNWKEGDYVFVTSLEYKNNKIVSGHIFSISKKEIAFDSSIGSIFFIIIFLVIVIIFMFFYFLNKRDDLLVELKRQQTQELNRNLKYIDKCKVDFDKIKNQFERKKKLEELEKSKKEIVKKIILKQKRQKHEFKKLRKIGKKDELKNKISMWKDEGYKMFEADKNIRKISKKGVKEQIDEWKKKGYDTSFIR